MPTILETGWWQRKSLQGEKLSREDVMQSNCSLAKDVREGEKKKPNMQTK